MPLYEYLCDACGHRFERIQKFSDPIADTCPKCGGAVHKLVSSPAIQFKGSGFYITDYAKADHTAAAKADSEPSAKTDKAAKGDATAKSDSASSSSESTASTTTPATPAASTPSASKDSKESSKDSKS